jgi:hypothetical protein
MVIQPRHVPYAHKIVWYKLIALVSQIFMNYGQRYPEGWQGLLPLPFLPKEVLYELIDWFLKWPCRLKGGSGAAIGSCASWIRSPLGTMLGFQLFQWQAMVLPIYVLGQEITGSNIQSTEWPVLNGLMGSPFLKFAFCGTCLSYNDGWCSCEGGYPKPLRLIKAFDR